MASEYALKLKASLDTTQVKQELNRLRAAQAQVVKEMGGTVNGAPTGVAHMQKIEVQLTKLNTTISGLQHAIEQLTRQQLNNNAMRNMPQHAGNLPYMPLGMNVPPELKRWIGSSAYKHFNDRVNAMLRNQASVLGNAARYNGKVYRLNATANAARMFDNGGLEALDPNLFNAYQNRMNKFMKKASPPEIRNQIRQARALAGFLGGQLLAGGGQMLTDLGHDRAGGLVGNAGTGLTSGGMAAGAMGMAGLTSVAAPIGILTGVVSFLASNYNDMQKFGEELNKSTEALVENYQVLRKQTTAINDRIISSRHQTRANQLLEAGDIDEAKKQAKYWSDAYESAKAAFEEGNPEGEQQKLLDEA